MPEPSPYEQPVFRSFVSAEPTGDWEYDLDDHGIVYGPGLWPFYRREQPLGQEPRLIPHPRAADRYPARQAAAAAKE